MIVKFTRLADRDDDNLLRRVSELWMVSPLSQLSDIMKRWSRLASIDKRHEQILRRPR